MDIKVAAFLAAVMVGIGANMGLIIAASSLGNVTATMYALGSVACAFVAQALFYIGATEKISPVLGMLWQIGSLTFWIFGILHIGSIIV